MPVTFKSAVTLGLFVVVSTTLASEGFRYPEGATGPATLRYHDGIPVLVVSGTPEEMAEQGAKLLGHSADRLLKYPHDLLERLATPVGANLLTPIMKKTAHRLYENFPPEYRAELEAMAKYSGMDREELIFANALFDQKHRVMSFFHCSAVVVEKERSATGQPLFGRNMDFMPLGYLHEYTLVTVFKPKGKHAFASIGFPGSVGVISGMNDAGLAVASLETTGAPTDQGPAFDESGVPFLINYRRILEECTTVDEAFQMLSKLKRATSQHLVVCDRTGGAVFEYTPTRVLRRTADNGTCRCTNHFNTSELKLPQPLNLFHTLDRLAKLDQLTALGNPIGVADIKRDLDAVNQGELTLQSMIFEPVPLRLHLAVAKGSSPTLPASGQPYHTLNLKALFTGRTSP